MKRLNFIASPLLFFLSPAWVADVFSTAIPKVMSWLRISRATLRVACGLTVAVAIPLSNAPLLCAESKIPKGPKQVENDIKAFFGGKFPEAVIAHLLVQAKSRPLSPSESLTLARAQFATRDFVSSLAIAQTLRGSFASEPKEAIHVHILIAEDFGALGQFSRAAYAVSQAQKLFPDSTQLAALRVEYYTMAGDLVNRVIAEDHLRMLDPAYHQKPVLFGIDDAIIIAGLAAYAAIVIFATSENVELTNRMILAALPLICL